MVDCLFPTYPTLVFSGDVEIDESMYGHKHKYHKGNPNGGYHIWICGLVEGDTKRIILYPVQDRNATTLLPLIKKHVAPGSRIFSDGWQAYKTLNDEGFQHFTVIHKHEFKRQYQNLQTGEKVSAHTNEIEGAWKHANDHFRRMNGTQKSNFESHLCEVVFRNHHQSKVTRTFFEEMKRIYPLTGKARYSWQHPVFRSWEEEEWADPTIVPDFDDREPEEDADNSPQPDVLGH
jgi:transposase-like protein